MCISLKHFKYFEEGTCHTNHELSNALFFTGCQTTYKLSHPHKLQH